MPTPLFTASITPLFDSIVIHVVTWGLGIALIAHLVYRASVASGRSPMVFASYVTQNAARVATIAGAVALVTWGLATGASAPGSSGKFSFIVLWTSISVMLGVLTMFLVRQFTAPPWWRLNAWGSDALHATYTGTVPAILGWIFRDAWDMFRSLSILDRCVVLIGMPALMWDVSRVIGLHRVAILALVMLLVAYLALAVALATANRIPRVLMTRLQDLRAVARRIATGDLSARAHVSREGDYEELMQLVNDVNTMAASLQLREQENAALQARLQHTLYTEQERATRDGLTGLRNNRYFHESLAAEIYRCSRTGQLVTIGLIDLDDFKKINDTFGHQEGDAVLIRVAQTLSQTLRPYDLACRLGGEEFGVIFPATTPEEAKVVLDRIAAGLQNAGPQGAPTTFSGGVSTYPRDAHEQHDLYEKADAAAYTAKSRGKAHTLIYDPAAVVDMQSREHVDSRHRDAMLATARSLVSSVDAKDSTDRNHSELVGRYAQAVARSLGCDPDFTYQMYLCGLLHDVGKIGIDDAIVAKPGQLTPEEFEEVKRHPEISAQVVANAGFGNIARWVRHHHEHWDGTGYPEGLAGEQIPLGARIILVTEAYEVMTSNRVYRKALPPEGALQELHRFSGSRFDPMVVEALTYLVRGDIVITGTGSRVPVDQIPLARPGRPAPMIDTPGELTSPPYGEGRAA